MADHPLALFFAAIAPRISQEEIVAVLLYVFPKELLYLLVILQRVLGGAQAVNKQKETITNRFIAFIVHLKSIYVVFQLNNTLDCFHMQLVLKNMKQKAIYPGTFDPVTNGHVDIISRAAKIFPELIVAVASNKAKRPYLSLETRIRLLKEVVGHFPGVQVVGFDNLLIDFVLEQKAGIILRGLRAVSDFEYEFQLAGMNRKLSKQIETLFLTPSENLMFISSTLVREIALLNGDVSQFVPACVVRELHKRQNEKQTIEILFNTCITSDLCFIFLFLSNASILCRTNSYSTPRLCCSKCSSFSNQCRIRNFSSRWKCF